MPFATKTVTTASGNATSGVGNFIAKIVSVQPIRALTINNTSAVNIFFTLGEKATESTDFFTVPPSTEMDFDVFELSDEDIHELWFASASAASFSVVYKYGPPLSIAIGGRQQGPKAAISG